MLSFKMQKLRGRTRQRSCEGIFNSFGGRSRDAKCRQYKFKCTRKIELVEARKQACGTSRFGPVSTRQQQSAEGKRLLSRVRHTLIHFQALALASYETWDRLLICSVSPFPH